MTILDLSPATTRGRIGLGFVDDLASFGSATALLTETGPVSYAALSRLVDEGTTRWRHLGAGRRLVHLELAPTLEAITAYLAALATGHAVIVCAPGQSDGIAATHRPDSIGRTIDGMWRLHHERDASTHTLHPDLALLLSTSGSTGSPKLVRLSWTNVDSNTAAIVGALGLRGEDVGVTTLPLHYCYGLSVLHTHLAVGAALVLTDASVADDALWRRMRATGVTSLSGVPHTFELLSAARRSPGDVPSIRQVTQAGGRLPTDRVRALATRGRSEGWDLRVMYGQTEATARMTIATAEQVLAHPERVGHPVDGGRVEIRNGATAVATGESGDLVYVGPNVMLGYAESPADLARGRTMTELETGDVARLHSDGAVEIVGRRSAFLKVLGLRVDLQRVEEALRRAGHDTIVGGDDEALHVLVAGPPRDESYADQSAGDSTDDPTDDPVDASVITTVTALAVEATGLPTHRIAVAIVDALPRTASGKPDRAAARAAHADISARTISARTTPSALGPTDDLIGDLVDIYATCLGRPDTDPDSTFVGLRGDSLSYVEVAVHLEERLGTLPADWPSRRLSDLATLADEPAGGTPSARTRRVIAHLDTTVVLRAVAITAIVAGHTRFATLLGGAHILLAVAGFNFARFGALAPTARERVRATGSTLLKIAIPTALWTGTVGLVAGSYSLANVFLVNWIVGPDRWTSHWRLWFIEALVWILVAVTALLATPRMHRWHARAPFVVAAAVATVALAARLDVFALTSPPGRGTAPAVLWLFAIGWAAANAMRIRERLYVSLLLVVGLPGFMDNPVREATIALGIMVLVWLPTLPVPRLLVPALGVLASSSLYIYLTHFQVYRATASPLLNLTLSLGLGIVTWWLVSRVTAALGRRPLLRRRSQTRWTGPANSTSSTPSTTSPPSTGSTPSAHSLSR